MDLIRFLKNKKKNQAEPIYVFLLKHIHKNVEVQDSLLLTKFKSYNKNNKYPRLKIFYYKLQKIINWMKLKVKNLHLQCLEIKVL